MWYVYIVQCNDGSFYTGISTDLEQRIKDHNDGRASEYTKDRIPVALLYCEDFQSKSEARMREVEIKKYGVRNKVKLIKRGLGRRFISTAISEN